MFLLLAACLVPAEDDSSAPARADDTPADEVAKGSKVTIETTRIEHGGADVEVTAPANATLLRVDACEQDDELVCEAWDGSWLLYEDGGMLLRPSAWDGSWAQVTWLKIE